MIVETVMGDFVAGEWMLRHQVSSFFGRVAQVAQVALSQGFRSFQVSNLGISAQFLLSSPTRKSTTNVH